MAARRATSAAVIALKERNRKALRLRASGLSHAQVAEECGFPSGDAARKAVMRLMGSQDREAVEEARGIHRERMETMWRSLWLAAINPGMAVQAARLAGHPLPPAQDRAIELLLRWLDHEAKFLGLYAPVRTELSGAEGGPIEGRLDVMHWVPDEAFMVMYARVLREAGLLDDDEVEEVRFLNPGAGDPGVDPE